MPVMDIYSFNLRLVSPLNLIMSDRKFSVGSASMFVLLQVGVLVAGREGGEPVRGAGLPGPVSLPSGLRPGLLS